VMKTREASTKHRKSRGGNGQGETRVESPPAISMATSNRASGDEEA